MIDRAGSRSLAPGDRNALGIALAEHPFCEGLDAPHVDVLADLAGRVIVPAGGFLFRRGGTADALYLVTEGDVGLEIDQARRDTLVLETLHQGDAVGWSWLYPPYRWVWDARATTELQALAVDASGLRATFATDTAFGLAVTWRVGMLVIDRLQHARAQLTCLSLP